MHLLGYVFSRSVFVFLQRFVSCVISILITWNFFCTFLIHEIDMLQGAERIADALKENRTITTIDLVRFDSTLFLHFTNEFRLSCTLIERMMKLHETLAANSLSYFKNCFLVFFIQHAITNCIRSFACSHYYFHFTSSVWFLIHLLAVIKRLLRNCSLDSL